MPITLDQIMSRTLLTVMNRKASADVSQLERLAANHVPRGFAGALRRAATTGPAMIAELKRGSPSRGMIREDYRPVPLARALEGAGAAALSVLTEREFFRGSIDDLEAVSQNVKIPILRKDFILDPFQILEARAAGADAILLIVAALSEDDLRELGNAARRLSMDVLCEVHTREELNRAVAGGFEIIGVNSRDLQSMTVLPATHMDLVGYLPASVLRVAESGIRTPADVERLLGAGYDAFLVGEALMRQPDPAAALALLMGRDYDSEV